MSCSAKGEREWEEIDHDPATNRRIFKSEEAPIAAGDGGTYDFSVAAAFEVRNDAGDVLLRTYGSASGEYWCGVFLFFVKGAEGHRVRLDESDREIDEVYAVPDEPPANPVITRVRPEGFT